MVVAELNPATALADAFKMPMFSPSGEISINDLFPSKSPIGAFAALDEEDKLVAFGNDEGDVKVKRYKLVLLTFAFRLLT